MVQKLSVEKKWIPPGLSIEFLWYDKLISALLKKITLNLLEILTLLDTLLFLTFYLLFCKKIRERLIEFREQKILSQYKLKVANKSIRIFIRSPVNFASVIGKTSGLNNNTLTYSW